MSLENAPHLNALLVTARTLDWFEELRVRDDEAHLLAPNPSWLAQAAHYPHALTYGLMAQDQAVGLISLIDPRLLESDDRDDFQPGCLYVWRLMIDQAARQKGHGKAAIAFALRYARAVGLDGISLTTMDREAGNALGFYQGLGFLATGRRLHGEIELVLRSASE